MKNSILILDNYDSFTYNLVHMIKELNPDSMLAVHRNDKISLEQVESYDKILLSPGPGLPSEAGIMPALIKVYSSTKSILGVCLGHQAIAEVFGATLYNLPEVVHGLATDNVVQDANELLFRGLPNRFKVGRYHSWVVAKESLAQATDLCLTATDDKGEIMALRHKHWKVRGVQFHPESVLTEFGKEMLQRWLVEA